MCILDFWAKGGGSLYVELSGDGVNFSQVWSSGLPGSYTEYALDLDGLAAGAGIVLDAEVYVRFRDNSGYYNDGYLDDVRIVTGDLIGPKVTNQVPVVVASGGGPLGQVTLTFNEPIDVASFTPADVVLKDPQGLAITPVSVAAVAGSTNRQFNLSFANQSVRGTYRLAVGPQVLDVAGNPMNQDGDAANGEATEDVYNGTVAYAPTVTANRTEDFEGWTNAVPSYWSLISAGAGTVQATSAGSPHSGAQHLKFGNDYYVNQYATLAVNLSSLATNTDVFLDFWAKGGGSLYVELSGDGVSFSQVWSSGLPGSYTEYALDLDGLAAGAGIVLDAEVYVRFRDNSGYYNDGYLG